MPPYVFNSYIFLRLQLAVPDEDVEKTSEMMTRTLPYQKMDSRYPDWLELRYIDRSQPTCNPNSVGLWLLTRPS